MGQKKLVRKTELPSKRGIRWPRWTGFRGKTVWDFLQLLIVPLMLAAIGLWFTAQQDHRQQQTEDRRAQQAQMIETQRAEAERELAKQRTQDEALQAYLNQMSNLLLENDLRKSKEDSEVRTLARARTLTVLGRLDPSRKTAIIQFLQEADLVQPVDGESPVISLADADLVDTNLGDAEVGIDLSGTNLFDANLSKSDLRHGDLSGATLVQADLRGANLFYITMNKANLNGADLSSGANLSEAFLIGADLSTADLSEADLHNANLRAAVLQSTNLSGADLSDAYVLGADLLGADLLGADLHNAFLLTADLRSANLSEADLSRADLRGSDLRGANLRGANLRGAYLNDVNLNDVRGLTKEQLEQAKTLEGATMPDGQYITREFKPALSFSVSADWRPYYPETTDALFIKGQKGGQLIFTNPLHVFDPSNPSEPKEVPAPENAAEWVSWFQRHPNLDTSKPVPVSVGDASGKHIDVTAASTLENYPRDVCGEQACVPLYKGSTRESAIVSYGDWKDRFFIVDVGDETVFIDVSAPEDKFDEFLPQAQEVLDTVEWSESE